MISVSPVMPPNKPAAATRRYTIQFMSHWFYNIIGFDGRALRSLNLVVS
jgi:hypothetical protein